MFRQVVLLLAVAALSYGEVIDFESLQSGTNTVVHVGSSYAEDGYQIAAGEDEPLGVFGTTEARYPGSTALFNDAIDGLLRLSRVDFTAFSLLSIDLACLNDADCGVAVSFTGTKSDTSMVNFVATPVDTLNSLTTFYLPAEFSDLVEVQWRQSAPFHQFDNITVAASTDLPEPGSMALLAGGLLAFGLLRRRRN